MAEEVDSRGRAIVLTTTREHAELKRDQIHAFGKDALIDDCAGSMSATIEPCPSDAPRRISHLQAASLTLTASTARQRSSCDRGTFRGRCSHGHAPHRHAGLQSQPVRDRVRAPRRWPASAFAMRPTTSRPICAWSTPAPSRPRETPKAGKPSASWPAAIPGTRIVVMGCYATRAPSEVAALPAVAEVVTDKRELPDLLGRFGVVDMPTGISSLPAGSGRMSKCKTAACCAAASASSRSVRPHLASRPTEHILDEVAPAGRRRLSRDRADRHPFGALWRGMEPRPAEDRVAAAVASARSASCRLPGEFRVRLSSIEATEVTRELIARDGASIRERICPHLHVSMQSGSDAVLRRMRRRWGSQRFVDRCRLVRDALDQPALTTDVHRRFSGRNR